jgi:hypothetical protein
LHHLADYAEELVGEHAAGIARIDDGDQVRIMAASSEQSRLLELFQLHAEQGPCLDCMRTGEPIVVPELGKGEKRWPEFEAEARKLGFAAAYAFPLQAGEHTYGALNVFGTQPDTLTEGDLQVARALANVAGLAVLHQHTVQQCQVITSQLQSALDSRIIIEQAKGALVARTGVSTHQAFAWLRRYARANRRRLSDVCRDVVEGNDMPAEEFANGLIPAPPTTTNLGSDSTDYQPDSEGDTPSLPRR